MRLAPRPPPRDIVAAVLRVLCATALALAVPLPRAAEAAPRPEELFRSTFAAQYAVQVTRVEAVSGETRGGVAYAFTSRRGTPGPGGVAYLRFTLRVHEYAGEREAAAALSRLARELAGDMFVKWPLLAFASGRSLYRLDGSCQYSPGAWEEIEGRLLSSVSASSGGPAAPRLRIACGGAVTESPAPRDTP